MNYRNLISALSLLGLLGCSTSQDDTLPNPQTSSEQVWQNQMSGGGQGAGQGDALSQTQGELRVPLDMTTLSQRQSDYTRDSWREATNVFPRLPKSRCGALCSAASIGRTAGAWIQHRLSLV